MIDAKSLEILNVAIADWDDNNKTSEDYEESRKKLEEIYSAVMWKDHYKGFPEHRLSYSEDMVCEDCGTTEWHVNLFYNNRNGQWFYGDSEYGENTTWCQKCECECGLVEPDEYEGDNEPPKLELVK